LDKNSGIDVLVAASADEVFGARESVVELSQWGSEFRSVPAYVARPSCFAYDELSLGYSKTKNGWGLSSITERVPGNNPHYTGKWSEYNDIMHEFLYEPFEEENEALLPNAHKLWPEWVRYSAQNVFNLAAQSLRETADAEISFVKSFEFSDYLLPGEVSARIYALWLRSQGGLVTMTLTGADVAKIMEKVSFAAPGVEPDYDDNGIYFTAAGIDANSRVGGLMLGQQEKYKVAMTAAAAQELQKQGILPKGRLETSGDAAALTVAWLQNRKKELCAGDGCARKDSFGLDVWDRQVRDFTEGRQNPKPILRLDLSNISLAYSNSAVSDPSSFSQVPDARVRAYGQLITQINGDFKIEYRNGKFQADFRALASYGRATVRPPNIPWTTNVLNDSYSFSAEALHRAYTLDKFPGTVISGPFVNLSYNGQFGDAQASSPIRSAWILKPGWKFFDGKILNELYACPLLERDQEKDNPGVIWGAQAGGTVKIPLNSAGLELKTGLYYTEYFRGPYDTDADFKNTLEFTASLKTPMIWNLTLSPYIDYYSYTSKLYGVTGRNSSVGVRLNYSFLAKPIY